MLSRYYGFTAREIKELTVYQYKQYIHNIAEVENIFRGEGGSASKRESYTESEILDIANNYGMEIPR